MCGIFGIISSSKEIPVPVKESCLATSVIDHRGPDDAGYLIWNKLSGLTEVYADNDTNPKSVKRHRLSPLPLDIKTPLLMGHRRLSIVDLSPGGFQPMVHHSTGISIVYNGEIYNYRELREELLDFFKFETESDTEVLLAAWVVWGEQCLEKLNGMFAFLVFDPRNDGKLYAVRDRFGIKPLYYANFGDFWTFASETKQFRVLPGYKFELNENICHDFLISGTLDHKSDTFERKVLQVPPGKMIKIDLKEKNCTPIISTWYQLNPMPWDGGIDEAAQKFIELFAKGVDLRLRSDVPLGSCLSGGLDSSGIVMQIHSLLEGFRKMQKQVTVTACFANNRYDEWQYASQVINKSNAEFHQVWPDSDWLIKDFEKMLWHMDEPFGSTSQFSQWCVFKKAHEVGLKVMLDGQGADEQLAGYMGPNLAYYLSGKLKTLKILDVINQIRIHKSKKGFYPLAYLILAIRNLFPGIDPLLPGQWRNDRNNPSWLRLESQTINQEIPDKSLSQFLIRQTLSTSLPALLRYEDRNSMAWSIESRVPFMDHHFVEFLAGLPDEYKLNNGHTKFIMRKALQNLLPEQVTARTDKMGFVTPEEVWLKSEKNQWFREQFFSALDIIPDFFNREEAVSHFNNIQKGSIPFQFTPWRILCLGKWIEMNRRGRT